MPKQTVERVFSRRAFILFLFLAPAALLTLGSIIVTAQYRQLQGSVSSRQEVAPFEWNDAGRARLGTLLHAFQNFSSGQGSDTLRLSAPDITLLAAASPAVKAQKLRLRATAAESLLVIETSQSIEDQNRSFSWIFKKIVPLQFQYVNARLEGLLEWEDRRLDFVPQRGFLNGSKVSRTALLKRAGMSPRDFLDESGKPAYLALTAVLDSAYYADGAVVLLRKPAAE